MTDQRFVLVDDDPETLRLFRRQLEERGHQVTTFSSGKAALEAVLASPPDCLLTDILTSELDGVELVRRLRQEKALASLKIVVVSSKAYRSDQERALEAGADGFVTKSQNEPERTVQRVLAVLNRQLKLTFWGCRGTIPVPGPNTLKYGGNTSCVSIMFPDGHIFVFDAGTGIKPLANRLVESGRKNLTGTIFLSHPHWDHINFLPFFRPLFVPGHQFTVVGSPVQGIGVEQLVANQMGGVHFPITSREFGAQVFYQDIGEGTFRFGPARVETMLLVHPGNCLGYAVTYGGRKICYVTDNELFPEDSDMHSKSYEEKLTAFVSGADLLITDTTYFDEEYPARVGWGHSSITPVCRLAHRAGVKELVLFHHDPDQDDAALERKLGQAQGMLKDWKSPTVASLALAEEEREISSLPDRDEAPEVGEG